MKIHWCAVYENGLEVAGRLDLCEKCLQVALDKGEDLVPYDSERAGVCERCGRKVGVPE